MVVSKKGITFAPEKIKMVVLAQLVRASDCGSEGRGFEPHIPPQRGNLIKIRLRAYFFMSTLYELIQSEYISDKTVNQFELAGKDTQTLILCYNKVQNKSR